MESDVELSQVSWRWFFWACVIAQAINFFSLVFFFPETRYKRDRPAEVESNGSAGGGDIVRSEKAMQDTTEIESQTQINVNEVLGQGKPSRQQFNFIQGTDQDEVAQIWRHLWTPIEIFFYPIICWAAWTMAGAANAFLLLVLFESPILSNPPYNFSTAAIGFANFAPAVGTIVALMVCGPLADWIAIRSAKRNRGIFEPEMRLPALVPFLAISLIALLVSKHVDYYALILDLMLARYLVWAVNTNGLGRRSSWLDLASSASSPFPSRRLPLL